MRCAETSGLAGVSVPSQGDSGTSAGSAYSPFLSLSSMPSRFCKNAFMLKWTLPVAPGWARVASICRMSSSAVQAVASIPTF